MKIARLHYLSGRTLAAAALSLALAACGGGKTVVESDLGIKGAPTGSTRELRPSTTRTAGCSTV